MEASTAKTVKDRISKKPTRSFLSTSEFAGSTRAVECALSRLEAKGEIRRVHKGLYWKGPKTPLGITPPRPLAVALQVAGLGGGPAGITAASVLGLTTQVPGVIEVAVPGRVPVSPKGVRFTSRDPLRRELKLSRAEVALIEVLRDWPITVEVDWKELIAKSQELIDSGALRPERITKDVEAEHKPALREAWAKLRSEVAV